MSSHVVLVTGVTSSVGKAIVRRLAFAGYKVAAADQCPNAVNDVVEDNKRLGGNVVGFSANVEDNTQRHELISTVTQKLDTLDSLVIVPPDNDIRGDIMDTDVKQFDKLFNDRLTIPFRLTQAALPTLQKSNAARCGVRVNAVCFGMVEQDGSGSFWDKHEENKALQQFESMIPIGRLGRPSDAASLVQFLISPGARYITGENCLLNGGVSFRL